ncbi:nitrous oxidase accessory protein [Atopomonas hussainii]|uniref:Nitrous oxidase accessory protein n=1 Tax=Atopomonas hussainii TaxID=1429083 RepID=A0A1H7KKK5_9GAMM|nr:nitrous oxide reductase family maturation protein NosD [Atopomonas hussainii]SEK87318.1 nitrous oxidase accessory protein [Atopomonas hussainii]
MTLAARLLFGLSLVLSPLAAAATVSATPVNPLPALPLQAQADGSWLLGSGTYVGNVVIDTPMTLRCAEDAILDGNGHGHVLDIRAANVVVEGCQLQNSGNNLTTLDSAVFIQRQASATVIRNNRLLAPAFGVWVDATQGVLIEGNQIIGPKDVRSQDRGNAIHLYAVSGAKARNNRVQFARDGIYIDTSNGNHLEGNVLEDVRYGIHYMFSHNNKVLYNQTRRTRTGYALMQSRQLTVIGNRSEDDQNYGILMNYITYSTLRDNHISRVQDGNAGYDGMIPGGEGKAVFIYNSQFNRIENNHFSDSALGIHLTAGSEDNKISGNAFINNRQQVKYVATRTQEWSQDGRGNFWSDYLGWDRNGDGLGDVAYEPNDNVDRLLWLYPQVRLLLNSPGIELLRWAQEAFPVTKSPGVRDSHPLLAPPTVRAVEDQP